MERLIYCHRCSDHDINRLFMLKVYISSTSTLLYMVTPHIDIHAGGTHTQAYDVVNSVNENVAMSPC